MRRRRHNNQTLHDGRSYDERSYNQRSNNNGSEDNIRSDDERLDVVGLDVGGFDDSYNNDVQYVGPYDDDESIDDELDDDETDDDDTDDDDTDDNKSYDGKSGSDDDDDDDGYDGGYNNEFGYEDDDGYDDGYDDSFDDDGFDDDGFDEYDNFDEDRYDSYNDDDEYDNIDKSIDEFENELKVFWDIFSAKLQALTTNINLFSNKFYIDSQRLTKVNIPTTPHPFTINIVDSTSVGVNHYSIHRHIFGIPLPPPKMSRFNIPRLCLYTGLRHGPRAANVHQLPTLTCGTRHQPRAPNHVTGTVWFGDRIFCFTDDMIFCLADDCFSAEHWISWIIGYLGFCIVDLLFFRVSTCLFLFFPIPFGFAI